MKNIKTFFVLIFSMLATSLFGQSINSNWKQDLNTAIETFKNCDQNMASKDNPCYKYIGESVNLVYQVNDFFSKEYERYLSGSEIIEFIKSGSQWKSLGFGYDQKALDEAQNYANADKAVIAVYMSDEQIGNVSLILPGKLSMSGSWGFNVPNSASFFVSEPRKSYLDKGLSYAFTRSMIRSVTIYGREY